MRGRPDLLLAAGVGLIYLAFLPPGSYSNEGTALLATAQSLITRGDFTVAPIFGHLGRHGSYYAPWYPLFPVLAVPFVLLGLVLGRLTGLPEFYTGVVSGLVLPVILTAAAVGLVARLARELGADERGAWLAALSFGFGTIAMTYAGTSYPDPLLALLTVGALYLAFGPRNWTGIILCSGLAGLAVLAKPSGGIIGPILAAYFLLRFRSARVALAPVVGMLLGLGLHMVFNVARFSNALAFGRPWGGFDLLHIPTGIAELLVSPDQGVLWYSPVVIVGAVGLGQLAKRKRYEYMAICGVFLGYVLIHAVWTLGDPWAWGPRFLLPMLPALLAAAAFVGQRWRRVLIGLTVLGFLVNAPTLVSFYERYYMQAEEEGIPERVQMWSPAHAGITNGWPTALQQIRDARDYDVGTLLNETLDPLHPARVLSESRLLRVVAVWWWMLPAMGLPRWIGALVAVLMVGGGIVLISRSRGPVRASVVTRNPGLGWR